MKGAKPNESAEISQSLEVEISENITELTRTRADSGHLEP
jgi:hypothetical protein